MTLFLAIFCTASCAGNGLVYIKLGRPTNLVAFGLMLFGALWFWSHLQ